MYKHILAALLILILSAAMTGCYFDPLHDFGYRNGHYNNGNYEGERKHGEDHNDHD
ncbi:MAG: hypothetical protein Q9M17_07290 [Mariprofundus sp.]|nr:hypothetical protein [Mariprofundus sp.]